MTARTKTLLILAIPAIMLLTSATFAVYRFSRPTEAVTASQPVSVSPQPAQPPTKEDLLRLVNAERTKAGVAPLTIDPRMNDSAQRKADDMQQYNYFGHVSLHDGRHGYEYMQDLNVTCSKASENIVGSTTAKGAIDWWDSSPAHYEAMVDPSNVTTGFGLAFVKDIPLDRITSSKPFYSDMTKSYVIVEHFCAP